MKVLIRFVVPGLLLLAGSFALCVSCSSLEQVSASEFLELTEEIPRESTIRNTAFIGTSGPRVYLERWHAQVLFESEVTVYWTELSELPAELSSELRAGRNPWEIPAAEGVESHQAIEPKADR